MSEIILEYTRAGHVENIHRADVVAVNCKGDILKEAGNGRLPMFWRSAAKPFQALAFVTGSWPFWCPPTAASLSMWSWCRGYWRSWG